MVHIYSIWKSSSHFETRRRKVYRRAKNCLPLDIPLCKISKQFYLFVFSWPLALAVDSINLCGMFPISLFYYFCLFVFCFGHVLVANVKEQDDIDMGWSSLQLEKTKSVWSSSGQSLPQHWFKTSLPFFQREYLNEYFKNIASAAIISFCWPLCNWTLERGRVVIIVY